MMTTRIEKPLNSGTVVRHNELVICISPDDVRKLCIEKNFYTCGDCKAYENMFSMCGIIKDYEHLANIAQDIVDHTDPMNEWIAEYEPFDEVFGYLQDLCTVELKVTFSRK